MTIEAPRVGVITFPGSLDDRDALRAVDQMGGVGVALWHADHDLHEVDRFAQMQRFHAAFDLLLLELRRLVHRHSPGRAT